MYIPSPTSPHFSRTTFQHTPNPYNSNSNDIQRPNKTKASPLFRLKINQLRLPLSPLVSVTTGRAHPWFPRIILSFWLLTEEQLDELAAFYHQRRVGRWSDAYPVSVKWDDGADLETKRRRFGRFVGLQGCESPGFEEGFENKGREY
ncbi:MAG: hypothetical protein M1816_002102 [Peltula sp. TS41687]|nr:MAG: hypothetical protein M1816_002102 [Peltula sp. TS41687]